MLKLFFSDAADPSYRLAQLRNFREQQERKLEQLRGLEEMAREGSHEGPYLSLQLGLALVSALVDSCGELERQLSEREVEA